MHVTYEKNGHIATVMIDRSKMNAINYEVVREFHDIWQDFERDDDLWVGILGTNRKHFSAGFDINDINAILEQREFLWKDSCMFGEKRLGPDGHGVTKPVIGAFKGIVNGAGMWLFLQTDIRVATPETVFGFAECKINFPVEFSGLLTRYLPRAIISEMLFSGKNIGAERFYNLGIVNNIVEEEHLIEEANKIARQICDSGPASVRVMKQLVSYGYEMEYQGLMAFSASMVIPIINTEDTREAIHCFLEKRKPEWKTR